MANPEIEMKRFYDYCQEGGIQLHDDNFTLRYSSDIPPHVGMAGSSAIITASMRALMQYYGVKIPRATLANLVLAVETEELRIPAGLQDRVIQAYEGVVFMDFAREHFERQGYGHYEEMDPALLPPLYVAFTTRLSEGTEVFHNDIRGRFNRGEADVMEAMEEWSDLTQRAHDMLLSGETSGLGALLDRNFDLRREIYRISEGNLAMVEAARSVGASAKFTGSGGAIVGTFEGEKMYQSLRRVLGPLGVEVLKPEIIAA